MLIFKVFYFILFKQHVKNKTSRHKVLSGQLCLHSGSQKKKNVSKRCEMCFAVLTDSGKQKSHLYLSLKSIQIKHMH